MAGQKVVQIPWETFVRLERLMGVVKGSGLTSSGVPASSITGVVQPAQGGTGTATELDLHIHVSNEDLTSQVNGVALQFTTGQEYRPGSLCVYRNGQRQTKGTDYTEDADALAFTFAVAPLAGDVLIVDYIIGQGAGQQGGYGLGPYGMAPYGL